MSALRIEQESTEATNIYWDFSGKTHVLQPYKHGCVPRNVGTRSGYSLWIKSIFPYKYPRRTGNRPSRDQDAGEVLTEYVIEERYSLVIRGREGEAWQGRYLVKDSPPVHEIRKARLRMRRMRLMDRVNAMIDLWALSALVALWAWFFGPVVGINLLPVALLVLLFVFVAARPRGKRPDIVMKLAGLRWSFNDFCRGWLVTGATGSGKTQGLTLTKHI